MTQQKTYCKRLKVMCPEHYKEGKVFIFNFFIICARRINKNHSKSEVNFFFNVCPLCLKDVNQRQFGRLNLK